MSDWTPDNDAANQDAPRFGLQELRDLRSALNGAMLYVSPVGISDHASTTWREAKKWKERVDSLIEETEEWEVEVYGYHA